MSDLRRQQQDGANYLLEAVDFVLPASFPVKRLRASLAKETDTGVEIDWLSESLAGLGCFIRSRKSFAMPPPFFFDFFAVADEGWSAIVMRERPRVDLTEFSACRLRQLRPLLLTSHLGPVDYFNWTKLDGNDCQHNHHVF